MPVHYENGVATAPETVVTAKMTPPSETQISTKIDCCF